jgi:putative radical SAM enzyme (TIGR03279 family)
MTYPTEVAPAGPGGRIASVEPGGPAERAGLAAGDIVACVEGEPLRDVIDWMWTADGDGVDLRVRDARDVERDVTIRRDWDEPWGLEFDGVVFDGIRECDNACVFCFVAQLPPGMRPALYVRDDDFRLSFLAGNFVTLTNLSDDDVDRIIEQRLSPMHVSLHAVDADVRRALMCPTAEDRALEFVDRLLAAGIALHVQIVLVPGVNDGTVLDRSLEWLAGREGVESVGIVPVGITRYQSRIASGYDSPEAARAVLEQLALWRARLRAERGLAWVHAADEFHLAAGEALPAWDDYDGFPQFENGIGMVRAFIDETGEELGALSHSPSGAAPGASRVMLITGAFFAPVLRSLLPGLARAGCPVDVLPVANDLLGGNVGVAGLLGGGDIARAVASSRDEADIFLIPDVAINDDELFLDDLRVADIAARADADVRLVSCDAAGLVSALLTLSTAKSG